MFIRALKYTYLIIKNIFFTKKISLRKFRISDGFEIYQIYLFFILFTNIIDNNFVCKILYILKI